MKQLILKMSVSVDGFVGGPNGEIDWIFRSYDAGATAWTMETLWQTSVHIMGSRTFQDMAAYWPTSTEPYAAPMNAIPKIVFSRSGQLQAATTQALADAKRQRTEETAASGPSSWTTPGVASGDFASEIARLKQQPGKPILAHGGAGFARSLVRHGLVTSSGCWCIRSRSAVACRCSPISTGRSISGWSAPQRSTAARSHTSIGRRDPRCRCAETAATSRPAGSSSAGAAHLSDRECGAERSARAALLPERRRSPASRARPRRRR